MNEMPVLRGAGAPRPLRPFRRALAGAVVMAVAWAAAPTLAAAAEESAAARLQQRVTDYWDAIEVFDLYTAYGMELGAKNGSLTPSEFRRRQGGTDWELVDHRIERIETDDGSAEVALELTFDVPQLDKRLTRPATDRWTYAEGDWYRDARDGPRPAAAPAR